MKVFSILIFLLPGILMAQQPVVSDNSPLKADRFIGVDKFKNVYFIKEMILRKEGPLGDFVFRDYQLGPISSVDIINPLNVVVFYEEANTVVFLDNRLNEINRLSFNQQKDFMMLKAVKNAGNNQLWIFDVNTQQLELYNYRNGRKSLISQPITKEIIWMEGDFNYCYVLTDNSLMKYNIYGSFLWEIEASEASRTVLADNRLMLVQDRVLQRLDTDTGATLGELDLKGYLAEKTPFDLHLNGDFLYLYNSNKLRLLPLTNQKK